MVLYKNTFVYLLKEEEIHEEAFHDLDAGLLHQMGIRMGQAMKLQKIVQEMKVIG